MAGSGSRLASEIEIGWTGRTVLTPVIESEHARARAALLRRRVLLWDNTPAADGPMRPMLHLNPYLGRPPALATHLSGALLNPMAQARASAVTVRTAADYLGDPEHYDPERSFAKATAELGSHAPEAFRLFAHAHRFSPLSPDDRDRELEAAVVELQNAIDEHRDPAIQLARLREWLSERADANLAVRKGIEPKLGVEITPWLESHAAETRRMLAAVECLTEIVEAKLAKQRVFALLALESKLSREPIPSVASYGPRRVLYPQLVSMRDDVMALSADPTLITNRCLADDLVALAERFALQNASVRR